MSNYFYAAKAHDCSASCPANATETLATASTGWSESREKRDRERMEAERRGAALLFDAQQSRDLRVNANRRELLNDKAAQ